MRCTMDTNGSVVSPVWFSPSPEKLLSGRLWQLAKSGRGSACWQGVSERSTTKHWLISAFSKPPLPFTQTTFEFVKCFFFFFVLFHSSSFNHATFKFCFFSSPELKIIRPTLVKLTYQTHSRPNTSAILAISCRTLLLNKENKRNKIADCRFCLTETECKKKTTTLKNYH